MNRSAVSFSNLSCGAMASIAPTAIVQNPTLYLAKAYEMDCTNVTDQRHSYRKAGKMFAAHDWLNHSQKEYARGEAHNTKAESFNANLERAKLGVFHYMSKKHLARYLHEVCFRWNHRIAELKMNKKGIWKIVMKPMPVIDMLMSMLSHAPGCQL